MSGHHSFWGAGGSGEKRRIGLCFGCQAQRREKAHTWIVAELWGLWPFAVEVLLFCKVGFRMAADDEWEPLERQVSTVS